MSSEIEKALVRTLVYSDIFDYPLTKEEVWKYLMSPKDIERSLFEQILNRHSGLSRIDSGAASFPRMTKRRFYFLKNRFSIVQTRMRRERESLKKLKIAKKVAGILSKIPTVQLIALSGALAMNNSEKDDDIDFFIITSKNCLWITRLLALIFLQILGYRRKRNEMHVSNKACLNMFMSEEKLSFPKSMQDLYTAHELLQMKVLFERNNTYSKLISSNSWVKKYLVNTIITKKKEKLPNILIFQYLNIFEKFAREIQLLGIKRHQTTEIVSDTLLAFHPKDYRKYVVKEYNKRLIKYKLL